MNDRFEHGLSPEAVEASFQMEEEERRAFRRRTAAAIKRRIERDPDSLKAFRLLYGPLVDEVIDEVAEMDSQVGVDYVAIEDTGDGVTGLFLVSVGRVPIVCKAPKICDAINQAKGAISYALNAMAHYIDKEQAQDAWEEVMRRATLVLLDLEFAHQETHSLLRDQNSEIAGAEDVVADMLSERGYLNA